MKIKNILYFGLGANCGLLPLAIIEHNPTQVILFVLAIIVSVIMLYKIRGENE